MKRIRTIQVHTALFVRAIGTLNSSQLSVCGKPHITSARHTVALALPKAVQHHSMLKCCVATRSVKASAMLLPSVNEAAPLPWHPAHGGFSFQILEGTLLHQSSHELLPDDGSGDATLPLHPAQSPC